MKKLMKNIILILTLFFLMTNGIIYYLTKLSEDKRIELSLKSHIAKLSTHYDILMHQQKLTADGVYESTMKKAGVIELLSEAYYSKDRGQRDILREQFFQLLKDRYRRLKKKGVLQFHFVFPNSYSFLRFHKPDKFGDDLTGVRTDFDYTNRTKTKISGFAQGRTSHAFRYVYPLFDKQQNHIGAMEISFSSDVLQANFTLISDLHTHFLVDKTIFDVKAWERDDLILKYTQSAEHSNYMMTMTKKHSLQKCIIDNKSILKPILKNIREGIKSGKQFSLYIDKIIDGEKQIIALAFIPVLGSVDKNILAWIVSHESDRFIYTTIKNTFHIRIVLFFILLILFYFIYKTLHQKESLKQQVIIEVEKNRFQYQQLIAQSRQAQMGEMMSMIAHQWRQPLNAISTTSINLNVKAQLGRTTQKNIMKQTDRICEFAEHLSTTINDFRDFFKANKEIKEVSFEELIQNVLNIVKVSITNKNIKLIQDLKCNHRFKTYPNEVKQVILNLVKNAEDVVLEKATENAFIKISTYTQNYKYILEVSDNGGGIPEEIIEKIFDPYFSTKKNKNGTGLGLYMSKTIIEEHCGGQLSVKNNEFGAVFKIEFNQS